MATWGEIFKIGAQVLGSIAGAKSAFGDQGGGVGGASPAQTQAGQTGLQYQDVQGTGISPFEFKEVLAQLEDEDQQRQMAEAMAQAQGQRSGGPVYASSGGDLIKGLLGASILGTGPGTFGDMGRSIVGSIGGIGKNIPPGLIGVFLQKYLDEKEEEEEESIVPMPANMGRPLYANQGMEIEEMIVTAPPIDTDVDLEIPELIEDVVVEEEQPTSTLTMEDIKADLDQMTRQQRIRDTFETVNDLIQTIGKIRNPQKSTISPRKSVTPLPGGGLGKRQAPYPQPKGSGITPFMYRGVADGGVLGRSMFAQNYMPHGGAMQGPGGPKDDLIPVMASDGEYMLSKAAVDQAGGGNHARGIANLEQFNNMGNRRYG